MQDPLTGNWIAYNGEIYNCKDLRARLEREGDRFAGHSDTEVILKALARWGDSFFNELCGMFAFAIWDAKRQRLFSGARSDGYHARLLLQVKVPFRALAAPGTPSGNRK